MGNSGVFTRIRRRGDYKTEVFPPTLQRVDLRRHLKIEI
jgi:hypothetical protein